ncbi:HdeD family acid-resistance protein [Arthrobacter psychrolactophilus]
MSSPHVTIDTLSIDPSSLTRQAIKGLRIAFAISGVAALALGIILLVWPTKTLAVVAVFLGINFLITGAVKMGVGIFSHSLSAGTRILDVLLGLLVLVAGIITVRNSSATGELLLIFTVIMIGIGWIIEGVIAMVEAGKSNSRLWATIFGVVSIIAGVMVLAIPGWTAAWLLLITALTLIVLGIVGLVRAFTFGK